MQAADSKRAEDIVALDVREVSLLADFFMICSANSERQLALQFVVVLCYL